MNRKSLNRIKNTQRLAINPTAKAETQPLRGGKKNADAIILQIAKSYKDRSRKDIQTWRLALMALEHIETPRYNRYFDLVDDLRTDGTYKTQSLLRTSATMSVGYQIRNRKTGDINELATELFQQQWYYRYLAKELESKIEGGRLH